MKNYFMLDGKKIPMSNETAKSLREGQKVYSIGDCFKVGSYDTIVMLSLFEAELVGGICLSKNHRGSRWTDPAKVGNNRKITKEELCVILNNDIIVPVNIKIEEI